MKQLKKMNLQLFADDSDQTEETNPAENSTAKQNEEPEVTPELLKKALKIAEDRTKRAESAALKSFFSQNGLSEEQAKAALDAYKDEQKKKLTPEAEKILSEKEKQMQEKSRKADLKIAKAELMQKSEKIDVKLAERLIDWDSVTVDDDGNVSGLDDQLEKLKGEFEYLEKKPTGQEGGKTNPPNPGKTGDSDEIENVKRELEKNPHNHELIQRYFLLKERERNKK